ncbi:hypothetical protein [Streptomyces sp. NPDC002851]
MDTRTASKTAPPTVDELMELLYATRGIPATGGPGTGGVDLHEHALRTAAQLRRTHPSDKELQVAGLVKDIGRLLRPVDEPGAEHADRVAADTLRPLLGERVARLAARLDPWSDDAATLHRAEEAGLTATFDPGVLEDWRAVLELVSAGATTSPSGV